MSRKINDVLSWLICNNHEYHVYIPSFEEFILLMKRGPQIIYPKDIGSILIAGNINKNSNIWLLESIDPAS